jgi:aldehyde dehydrogenase (NAD+)
LFVLPAGAVNIVHGSGSRVGLPLAGHPGVRLVSFTGSSGVGRELSAVCGKALRRLSLELGGKNGQIVMDDADLELALEGALWGAFGTAGQRCTATSRILVHKKVVGEFTKLFVERVKKMKVGNGLERGTDMGPVVNRSQVEKASEYVDIGRKEGAKMLCGGEPLTSGAYRNGFFFQPTVFGNVKPDMRIAQEEIFNPVTTIIEFRDFDEAVKFHNDTAYGLSSSIYTRDVNAACRAIRDLEAGITYINAPTIGAEVHLPFGGVKDTGNGHRDAGPTMLDVFSEWKSVFFDYSGRLQKAQIDHD